MKKRKQKEKQSNQEFKNSKINLMYKLIFLVFIPLILCFITVSNFFKQNSDLKIELIESGINNQYAEEVLRLGINNHSEDAKKITKAILNISDIREDNDSYNFNILCENDDNGITISVYNDGWSDIFDVSFSVPIISDFYSNLWHPEKYNKTFKVIKPGKRYVLGSLTANDLKDKTRETKIEFSCKTGQANSNIYGHYTYDKHLDKVRLPGVGGPTETYLVDCFIDTRNGAYKYEIPVEYTCDAHFYEEIRFIFSANRSCHVKYSLELYSNNKCLFKTQEKGTYIRVNSLGKKSFEE